ncbi:large conductance mechanosensitive channel protein MscL [Faecalicatena contorta]|uniref:Large-conductance mechanosensitive channel n=1 Tax=Faecalicatena contorta TaxID=39482 RepID=A0A316A120_9FIRM|nr:large conductance mechanosensitive channel protein MscL [Faecalicatena contorta]PWJ51303.1 large conductance mechanosensitive channel [Faecalicatena contorta]SUQ12859.1 large conductance mechanosensitive channel [Faecalicatena contorta]
MKKFMEEFKAFISRGNVMDMAVGIIIGGAFTSIVSSLVEDIINPVLGLFGGMNLDKISVKLFGEVTLNYGKFIASIINFLLMSFVLFLIIRTVNKAASRMAVKQEEEEKITTKTCPFCKTEIAVDASRCPHCTSMLVE